ncbi:hypothetical protein [Leptospira idonii]|uniref:Uncharacterized protein n=1 Tax=Leptospira idonii TaxID=1193500 RepID=A0A4R9LWP5_9LEPT|nr:hypothetical protein [Leptospira idonii]TGN17909.1 hypothetical protein EHS15_15935 [Leptospira idonii]
MTKKLKRTLIMLVFALIGFAMYTMSLIIDQNTILKNININQVLSNIGVFLIIVPTMQFFFDSIFQDLFFEKIFIGVLGSLKIKESGIISATNDSKEINSEDFLKSEVLIIGFHYSTRFIETHHSTIIERSRNKLHTTILYLDPTSEASIFLQNNESTNSNPNDQIQKLKNLFEKATELNREYLKLIPHKSILKYSFILTDNYVWIKFYTNQKGVFTKIPAIKVTLESPMYNFFKKDINGFLNA